MKVVVDTNILFSFFWKESLTRKFLMTSDFELVSPEIALRELKKYSEEIINKINLSKKEFGNELENLKSIVKFIEKREYSDFIKQAKEISPDENDAEFFALCLKFSCFFWSNDSFLKKQNKIKVLSTEDIIELIF